MHARVCVPRSGLELCKVSKEVGGRRETVESVNLFIGQVYKQHYMHTPQALQAGRTVHMQVFILLLAMEDCV